MCTAFERSTKYSETKLGNLRASISSLIPEDSIAITVGSYARREASDQSDLDHFVVAADDGSGHPWVPTFHEAISAEVKKAPASGGAFDAVVTRESLLTNIGGSEDSNQTITRRMLFLLEGEWMSNEEGFIALRREMLERYVQESLPDQKLTLFLLNDIIRYWRTITVDFEHKTSEGSKPKPWAVRKLKLTFSRKLLYAGGLFSVGMTSDLTPARKRETLEHLFGLPALGRMEVICGKALMQPIRESYDKFLCALEKDEVRDHLDGLNRDSAQLDETYRDLNNEAQRYTRALLSAFEVTFHATHPIRRAVIF